MTAEAAGPNVPLDQQKIIQYEGAPPSPGAGPGAQQVNIRYNQTEMDRRYANERIAESYFHCRPYSCYVAAIGNHWKPGSWAAVLNMVHYCNGQGMYVVMEELQDRCLRPYDALGTMRNEALIRAEQGFEFICYIDNDVLPDETLLARLMLRNVPIVAPYVVEPGSGRPLHGPVRQMWKGLQPVRWNVLSMMVHKTAVYRAFPPGGFWKDAVGADEGYHFQQYYAAGHTPMIDTDVVMQVCGSPLYPLTVEKGENSEAVWAQRKAQFSQLPDRRPVDPTDPRQENGVYMPFLAVPCSQCREKFNGDWWRPYHANGLPMVCPTCEQKILAHAPEAKKARAKARAKELRLAKKEGRAPAPLDPLPRIMQSGPGQDSAVVHVGDGGTLKITPVIGTA